MAAICVKDLSKIYPKEMGRLSLLKMMITGQPPVRTEGRVVLDGVSFEVSRGESVGIVGRNGAGKTTLLKLLAGIAPPSSGLCELRGRATAILELGTGFHPQYTGIENVRINGMLLGLSRREINARLEAIVDFSELGEAIHQPLKSYSTGMQARLAFAIATAVRPEILLIDEVLAVGDAYFVNKCIQYLIDFIRCGGTFLVVSHNTFLISRLCQTVVWLEGGRLMQIGPAQEVCHAYEADVLRAQRVGSRSETHSLRPRWGSGEITLRRVALLDSEGQPRTSCVRGERLIIQLHYEASGRHDGVGAYVLFRREDGVLATSTFSAEEGIDLGSLDGTGVVEVQFDPLLLGDGRYIISAGLFPPTHGPASIYRLDPYDFMEEAAELSVKRPVRPLQTVFDHPVVWNHVRVQ